MLTIYRKLKKLLIIVSSNQRSRLSQKQSQIRPDSSTRERAKLGVLGVGHNRPEEGHKENNNTNQELKQTKQAKRTTLTAAKRVSLANS